MPDDESQISTIPSTSDGYLRLFLNGGFAAFNLRYERSAEGRLPILSVPIVSSETCRSRRPS